MSVPGVEVVIFPREMGTYITMEAVKNTETNFPIFSHGSLPGREPLKHP